MMGVSEQQKALIQDAAEKLAATEGLQGIALAATIQYVVMDENGEEHIGGFYIGGYVQALGLLEDAKTRLLFPDE